MKNSPKAKHAPKEDNRRVMLDPFAVAAIRLLILTGARLREILHARWEHVDFERGVILAAESLTTNNVFVIGAATNTVLTTIPVDAHYVYAGGIAVSPDGKRIYYGTGADDGYTGASSVLLVIDTATNKFVTKIKTGVIVNSDITCTPDGKHAYAMIDAPSRDGEFVEVIDTVANNLTGTVRLDALAHGGIAITPDGTRVYVNVIFRRDGSRGVSVIETATNAVAANLNNYRLTPVGS
jgi:DNA-binding beta-propeller fold protein YncE